MIAFAGLSHLGIVSAAATAARGFDVMGFDPDGNVVAALQDGKLPVSEPGLPELLQIHRARLGFTSDPAQLARCDLVVFSLDVPTDAANRSNLEPLDRLIERVLPHLGSGATIVILCQVPPGFTRKLAERL